MGARASGGRGGRLAHARVRRRPPPHALAARAAPAPRRARCSRTPRSVAADVTRRAPPTVPVHVVHNAVDLQTFAPDGPVEDLDRRAGLTPPAVPSCASVWWRRSRAGRDTRCSCARLPRCRATCRCAATSLAGRCTTRPAASTRWRSCRRCADRSGPRRPRRLHRLPAARSGHARPRRRRAREHAAGAVRPGDRRSDGVRPGGDHERRRRRGGAHRRRRGRGDAYAGRRRRACRRASSGLRGDPSCRRELGSRARASACRRFDPDRLAREVVAVYEAIAPLARRRRRRRSGGSRSSSSSARPRFRRCSSCPGRRAIRFYVRVASFAISMALLAWWAFGNAKHSTRRTRRRRGCSSRSSTSPRWCSIRSRARRSAGVAQIVLVRLGDGAGLLGAGGRARPGSPGASDDAAAHVQRRQRAASACCRCTTPTAGCRRRCRAS